MKTLNKTTLAIAVAVGSLASANAATIAADSALIPTGLGAGDSFQLAFVSSTTTTRGTIGSDADIAYWNAFVNTVADNNTYVDLDARANIAAFNWSAIASTSIVNAKDNAVVSGAVYNMNDQSVATSSTDMWDGSIANLIQYYENGSVASGAREVWTGSYAGGVKRNGLDTTGDAYKGQRNNTGSGKWIYVSTWRGPPSDEARVYGLSEVITVVPEPSTTALLGLGGFALILRRRK